MQGLSLFPDDVTVKRLVIGTGPVTPLFPDEERAVERVALRRRREFETGRLCARLALAELGVAPCGIPIGTDGMPIWPAGAVGSITHDGDEACAAAAPDTAYRSVGIDVAAVGSVSADLAALICANDDVTRLADLPATADHLGLLFSAKESIYKCFYPLNRVFLEFSDVVVDWVRCDDDRSGAFHALFVRTDVIWGRSRPIVGRWSIDRGRVYTSAYYRRREPADHDDDQYLATLVDRSSGRRATRCA